MGDIGHGPIAKTMNNYLLRANGCAPIEAGRLASAAGIDLPKLRKALGSGDGAALRDRMTFARASKDMQAKLSEGGNMTLASLVEELVKDGRAVKATDPPDWTGERRPK